MEYTIVNGELYHHGIKGQKWGQRRWQNADGTFNDAGKRRYFGNGGGENYHKLKRQVRSASGNVNRIRAKMYESNQKRYEKSGDKVFAYANKKAKEAQLKKAAEADKKKAEKIASRNTPEAKAKRAKKAAIVGASVVAAGLAAYGGYKLYQNASYKKSIKDAIAREAMMEKQRKGEQALRKMYDQMAKDAMKNGATYYSFADNKIGYKIEMGKPRS